MTLLLITKYGPRCHVTFLHISEASPGNHYVLSCSQIPSLPSKHSSVLVLNLYFISKGILNYFVCLTYNEEKPVLVQNQIFLKKMTLEVCYHCLCSPDHTTSQYHCSIASRSLKHWLPHEFTSQEAIQFISILLNSVLLESFYY